MRSSNNHHQTTHHPVCTAHPLLYTHQIKIGFSYTLKPHSEISFLPPPQSPHSRAARILPHPRVMALLHGHTTSKHDSVGPPSLPRIVRSVHFCTHWAGKDKVSSPWQPSRGSFISCQMGYVTPQTRSVGNQARLQATYQVPSLPRSTAQKLKRLERTSNEHAHGLE